MSFLPTAQQAEAAEKFCAGHSMVIEALAGTGKTTVLRLLANHPQRPRGKILYTAFGKRVVEEAKGSFPSHVSARTNHSLAWGFGAPYQKQNRLVTRWIPKMVMDHPEFCANHFTVEPVVAARWIIQAVSRFTESADRELKTIHSLPSVIRTITSAPEAAKVAREVIAQARAIWEDMMDLNSRCEITHDVYLKKWALTEPRLPYDIILLDEAQDGNAVVVDLLKKQTHCQMIIVGDRQQAIYGFRGAMDAMDAFQVDSHVALTQSFRFGPQFAELANAILKEDCQTHLRLIGDPSQPGKIAKITNERHTLIARRNATLVREIVRTRMSSPSLRLGVISGVAELITWVHGVEELFRNRRTKVPELAEFASWNEVKAAAEQEAYAYLRKLVVLVEEIGTQLLLYHLESVRGNEMTPETCHILYSTAHGAKGREWSNVRLADDFAIKGPPDDPFCDGWQPEDANLLYVASTRARKLLDVTECEAVSKAWGVSPWPQ